MTNVEKRTFSRVCRQQAALASTAQVGDTLITLAGMYEAQADAHEGTKAVNTRTKAANEA